MVKLRIMKPKDAAIAGAVVGITIGALGTVAVMSIINPSKSSISDGNGSAQATSFEL